MAATSTAVVGTLDSESAAGSSSQESEDDVSSAEEAAAAAFGGSSVSLPEAALENQFGLRGPLGRVHVGLVGKGNVGKTTLFNALTGRRQGASPWPYETVATTAGRVDDVAAADAVLDSLCAMYAGDIFALRRVPLAVTVVDGPAVEGPDAARAFAAFHCCRVDVLLIIVRDFDGDAVTQPGAVAGPEVVEASVELADVCERLLDHDREVLLLAIRALARDRGRGTWRDGEFECLVNAYDIVLGHEAQNTAEHVELLKMKGTYRTMAGFAEARAPADMSRDDRMLRLHAWTARERAWLGALPLCTTRAVVVAVNMDLRPFLVEAAPRPGVLARLRTAAHHYGVRAEDIVPFSGAFEARLQALRATDGSSLDHGGGASSYSSSSSALGAYLDANPTHRTALTRLVSQCHEALGLITVYCCSPREVRRFAVDRAATIHDVARGLHEFLGRALTLAEVADVEDLLAAGSERKLRKQGKIRRLAPGVVVEDHQVLWLIFNMPSTEIDELREWVAPPPPRSTRLMHENNSPSTPPVEEPAGRRDPQPIDLLSASLSAVSFTFSAPNR